MRWEKHKKIIFFMFILNIFDTFHFFSHFYFSLLQWTYSEKFLQFKSLLFFTYSLFLASIISLFRIFHSFSEFLKFVLFVHIFEISLWFLTSTLLSLVPHSHSRKLLSLSSLAFSVFIPIHLDEEKLPQNIPLKSLQV